jgi:hypothetical protein
MYVVYIVRKTLASVAAFLCKNGTHLKKEDKDKNIKDKLKAE